MRHEEAYITQKARTGLAVTAAINIIGMVMELVVSRSLPNMPFWPPVVSIVGGTSIFYILYLYKFRLTLSHISILYLLNTCLVAIVLYMRNPVYAEFAANWVPFQASKLGCMIVALTAPNFIVGIIGIAVHAGGSILSFLLFTTEIREGLAFGEPIPIFAFAMASIFALLFRTRQMSLEHRLQRSLAEAAAMKSLAEAFVHLRDLMNTPLQTIELSVSMLDEKHDKQKEILDIIRNSLKELGKLNQLLSTYEKKVDWKREPHFFEVDKKNK